MLRILVVCTGNTCRSPMAEALLNELVRRNGLSDSIKILSAGLAGYGENPASDGARAAMARRGLDLTGHRSRLLLPEYIQAADLVLTMTGTHKQAVLDLAPPAAGKVFTLAEYAGQGGDVGDPFNCDQSVYEECAADIDRLLTAAWLKIAESAGKVE